MCVRWRGRKRHIRPVSMSVDWTILDSRDSVSGSWELDGEADSSLVAATSYSGVFACRPFLVENALVRI